MTGIEQLFALASVVNREYHVRTPSKRARCLICGRRKADLLLCFIIYNYKETAFNLIVVCAKWTNTKLRALRLWCAIFFLYSEMGIQFNLCKNVQLSRAHNGKIKMKCRQDNCEVSFKSISVRIIMRAASFIIPFNYRDLEWQRNMQKKIVWKWANEHITASRPSVLCIANIKCVVVTNSLPTVHILWLEGNEQWIKYFIAICR